MNHTGIQRRKMASPKQTADMKILVRLNLSILENYILKIMEYRQKLGKCAIGTQFHFPPSIPCYKSK